VAWAEVAAAVAEAVDSIFKPPAGVVIPLAVWAACLAQVGVEEVKDHPAASHFERKRSKNTFPPPPPHPLSAVG